MGKGELVTIKEVSDYLKVADKTIYRMAMEGKIPAFKVGGSWRFYRHEVLEWLENQRNNKQVKQ